jgi:murein endopeptidase
VRRAALAITLLLLAAPVAAARPALDSPLEPPQAAPASRALGLWYAGRLANGVQLPAEGFDYVTWDPVLLRTPNRGWRRWGTQGLIDMTTLVLREYRDAHPDAPRVLVGDLSRPQGGPFGRRYGGLGHASHQNGLDVDIYYPRKDGRLIEAAGPSQVDREASQELLDRFVRAGAMKVYTGPSLGLRGPRKIVQKLVHHDDHMHVRIRRRSG